MTEEHVFDLLPGYALGSLDEEELVQVAHHLPRCAQCRSELSSYFETVDHLVLAAPLRTPPPDLRVKLMRRVEGGARLAGAAAQPPAAPRRGLGELLRGLFGAPAGLAFGALALVVLVILAVSSVVLWQRANDLQARLPAGKAHLVNLRGTNNAPGAHGYLMVFKEETYGALVVEDAPPLPPGHQYQLWLIKDGKRTSGGVFSVDQQGYGTLQVSARNPLEQYSSFGVTIEPAGGSPGPTGKKVLGGDL